MEESGNLQQKMQEQEGDFSIIIKESHSWVANVVEVEGDNGFFMKPTAMESGIIWRLFAPTPPPGAPDASSQTKLQLLKERVFFADKAKEFWHLSQNARHQPTCN